MKHLKFLIYLTLIKFTIFARSDFINPPANDTDDSVFEDLVWQTGSTQELNWFTNASGITIYLYQIDLAAYSKQIPSGASGTDEIVYSS